MEDTQFIELYFHRSESAIEVSIEANKDMSGMTRQMLHDDYVLAGFPESSGSGSYFVEAGSYFKLYNQPAMSAQRTSIGIMADTEAADGALLHVIRSECEAYLAGNKTAEQAAQQIQSRLSIYLAEQS